MKKKRMKIVCIGLAAIALSGYAGAASDSEYEHAPLPELFEGIAELAPESMSDRDILMSGFISADLPVLQDKPLPKQELQEKKEQKRSSAKYSRFICNRCDRSFTRGKDLHIHIDNVHKGIRHYCSFCWRRFTQKSSLAMHVQNMHAGECRVKRDRHACPSCVKSFVYKTHLKTHIKSVHEHIRHQCPSCEKSFTQNSSLNRHIKSSRQEPEDTCILKKQRYQ